MRPATEELTASSGTPVAPEIELVLPDGMTLPEYGAAPAASGRDDDLEDLDVAAPPPAPTPAAPAPRPASREPDRLPPAAREERTKRKKLAAKYADLLAENEALRAQAQATAPSGAIVPRLTAEQRAVRAAALRQRIRQAVKAPDLAKLRKDAEAADSLGDMVELLWNDAIAPTTKAIEDAATEVLTDLTNDLEVRDQVWQGQINTTRAKLDEDLFRSTHADYDAKLTKAGIFAALRIVDGRFVDPLIARKVYTAPNAAARAYELAEQKLAYEAEEAGTVEPEPNGPSTAPSNVVRLDVPRAAAMPHPAAVPPSGGRELFDAQPDTPNRARGIRHLPDAGGPRRARMSREYLDWLMESHPGQYLALVEANPALDRWHMSD